MHWTLSSSSRQARLGRRPDTVRPSFLVVSLGGLAQTDAAKTGLMSDHDSLDAHGHRLERAGRLRQCGRS